MNLCNIWTLWESRNRTGLWFLYQRHSKYQLFIYRVNQKNISSNLLDIVHDLLMFLFSNSAVEGTYSLELVFFFPLFGMNSLTHSPLAAAISLKNKNILELLVFTRLMWLQIARTIRSEILELQLTVLLNKRLSHYCVTVSLHPITRHEQNHNNRWN